MPLLKNCKPKNLCYHSSYHGKSIQLSFQRDYSVIELDSLSITNSKYTISFY